MSKDSSNNNFSDTALYKSLIVPMIINNDKRIIIEYGNIKCNKNNVEEILYNFYSEISKLIHREINIKNKKIFFPDTMHLIPNDLKIAIVNIFHFLKIVPYYTETDI